MTRLVKMETEMSVVRFRGLHLFLDQKCIHTYNLERGGVFWNHRDTNGKGNEIFKKDVKKMF